MTRRLCIAPLLLLLAWPVHAQWARVDQNIGFSGSYVNTLLTATGNRVLGFVVTGPPINVALYATEDSGDTWTLLPNYPSLSALGIPTVATTLDGRVLVAGLAGDASEVIVLSSDDNGDIWTDVRIPGGGAPIAAGKSVNAYFLGTRNTMLRSTDDGQSWQELPNSPIGVAQIAATGSTVYAASIFFERSTDNGETWERISLVSGQAPTPSSITGVWAVGNTVYAKSTLGPIFASADDGNTWVEQSTFDTFAFFTAELSPSRNAWAFHAAAQSMYLTTDQGATAINLQTETGFPQNLLGAPCVGVPVVSETHVFASLGCFNEQSGVYRYAYSGGTNTSAERPEHLRLALDAPYPNPTTNHTTLLYTLEEPAPVHLALYDMLGREVRPLRTGYHPDGMHRIQVSTTNLSAGTYWVRLTADEQHVTRMLHIVR